MSNVFVITWALPAALSFASLLARRPWTAILARRRQPREVWSMPIFHETNLILTAAWTCYFVVAALATWAVPWSSLLFGAASWPLSEASHRFGAWYSTRRLGSLAAPL